MRAESDAASLSTPLACQSPENPASTRLATANTNTACFAVKEGGDGAVKKGRGGGGGGGEGVGGVEGGWGTGDEGVGSSSREAEGGNGGGGSMVWARGRRDKTARESLQEGSTCAQKRDL